MKLQHANDQVSACFVFRLNGCLENYVQQQVWSKITYFINFIYKVITLLERAVVTCTFRTQLSKYTFLDNKCWEHKTP